MPARRTRRDRIIDATLDLAGEGRWQAVTLSAVAARAGCPLTDLRREFSGRGAILAAFIDRIDVEMLAGADESDAGEAARDRLFDLVMRRLDALAPYKPALRSIARDLAARPAAQLFGLRRVLRSQRWVLDAAGIAVPGLGGRIRTVGLAAVYLDVFRVWLVEDDAGLPRTMARLDRLLRRGERGLSRLEAPIALADAFGGFCAALAGRRASRPAPPDATSNSDGRA
jgi:AcrR family transcriptional regulator